MRSKRREICIRILPCGYSHIQFDQQKGVAEIQRRRALVAVEFPLASQCHSSEMNGPTIRARNARPELMFRQVDQGFLQIVCDLCHSPYIQKARIFTQNSRRGIAAERRVIFGGTPAWIDLERGKLAARSNNARANKHQTNKSLYAALAPSSGRTRCETQNPATYARFFHKRRSSKATLSIDQITQTRALK